MCHVFLSLEGLPRQTKYHHIAFFTLMTILYILYSGGFALQRQVYEVCMVAFMFYVSLILPGKSPISIAICFFSPAQISQLDFTEGIQSETANSQTVSPFLVLPAIPQSSHLQKVYNSVYFLLQSVLFLYCVANWIWEFI